MAISEFEIKRSEKELEKFLLEHRPPAHIRNEFDIGYRIKNQSVEIFEIRAQPRDPEQKIESSVAKATFVKSQNNWKIFWFKSDMKWHQYPPAPTAKNIEDFLAIVGQDENGCFWG